MSIRVLLLEDNPADAELITAALSDAPEEIFIQHVETREDYVSALNTSAAHIVLADYQLPQFNGMEAFRLLRKCDKDRPFILVSGHIGETSVVNAMHEGVGDCIMKDQLHQLMPAVRRELSAARQRRKTERAEKRQTESDMLYKALLTQMSDGVLLILNGNIRFVNPSLADMLGYTEKELVALPITALFTEQDFESLAVCLSDEEETNAPRSDRMHLRHREGTLRLADVRTSVITHCDRKALLLTVHDLTRDLKIRRNIAQYAFIAEAINEFVIITDPVGIITYFNSAMRRGLSEIRDISIGDSIDSLLPLMQSGTPAEVITARIRAGEAWQSDLRLERESDQALWLSVTASSLEFERDFIGLVWIARDISDRLNILEELKRSEENFRTLTEQSLVGVYVIQEFRFTYVNPMFAEIFQRSVEEILALESISVLVHPDDRALVTGNIQKRMRGEVPRLRYSFKAVQHGGDIRNVEVMGSLTMFQGKHAIIGTLIDITDQKRAEQSLIAAKELAERSDRLKDAFIANISHEIRTPLNIIMGYGSLVRAELDDSIDEQQAEYFNSMQRAGDRLMRTVELILNLSSIQSGTFIVNKEVLNISVLLQRVHRDLFALAEARGLTLTLDHDASPLHILADRYCLEQALMNVIENALKFTKEGGVALQLWEESDEVIILVTDTGVGIEKEFLPKLFDPFSQESLGLGRPFEGLGLGLALTRQYVTLNGGRVTVTSEKNQGTEVQMCFPSCNEENSI